MAGGDGCQEGTLRLALGFYGLGTTRVARNLFSTFSVACGRTVASLTTRPFDGVASAAMVYDDQPVLDHIRGIDDNHVMGAMFINGRSAKLLRE
ncbi:DUF4334 domain-containing protein [Ensifer sp. NPDC090286]|uniref:DUF4334 domain-containing protein n=1 Tax=Ensifer sp. NPDC090286 TaxID=3363991 RepID=UPI00383A9C28